MAQTLDQQYEFLFPNLITAIAQSPPSFANSLLITLLIPQLIL